MTDTRFDVVGVGANAIDDVFRLPESPTVEGAAAKLRIRARSKSLGGQTATTLITCAAAGLRTAYVGTVGNDSDGDLVRRTLAHHGVDTACMLVRKAPTAYAVILLDERNGERIVLWDRHAALRLDAADVLGAPLTTARLVHVDDVDEAAAIAAATRAAAAGIPVTSDIERVGTHTDELLDAVSVAIFAAHMPQALTSAATLESALRTLRGRYAGLLCVTRGARGALMLDGNDLHEADAPAVVATDTTGAGDVFRGALIASLLQGDAPARMLAVATAAASLSCTRLGAISSVPTPEEMARLLA